MSGKKVSGIIFYEVDEKKNLKIKRDIIFPQLRTFNKSNEADWKKYRAYFRKNVLDDQMPTITYKDKIIVPSQVDSIEIGGMISFYFTPIQGIQILKTLYPSMNDRCFVEEWSFKNLDESPKNINLGNCNFKQEELGYKGIYTFIQKNNGRQSFILNSNESKKFPVFLGALLNGELEEDFDHQKSFWNRQAYLKEMNQNLSLETPDETINTLFYFSKIRAAESIFDSTMGLVHSPGGGNYYCGIWANDQIEYCGPFFPYLGYERGNEAAYNAYHKFLENIPKDDKHIPYAFEVDGNFAMTHLDRGDAAMISYGTSKFALSMGDKAKATNLWPLIQWSLNYCHKQKNEQGAVQSASDEMEGRVETGKANLSTSTLYYGGLKFGSILAFELGFKEEAELYKKRSIEMEAIIENYFGAEMQGLQTYKYYETNDKLRHWICLPLCMGINTRKDGTLKALFEKLWTPNGVLVEYDKSKTEDEQIFWDRATLYALRGAIKSGALDIPFQRLKAYTNNRLLGEHVPYAVEAYPENNMKHLSAESALYCRIFIEGLFGIEPTGFNKIRLAPQLPASWNDISLKNVFLSDETYDINLKRHHDQIILTIFKKGKIVFSKTINEGQIVEFSF